MSAACIILQLFPAARLKTSETASESSEAASPPPQNYLIASRKITFDTISSNDLCNRTSLCSVAFNIQASCLAASASSQRWNMRGTLGELRILLARGTSWSPKDSATQKASRGTDERLARRTWGEAQSYCSGEGNADVAAGSRLGLSV